MTSNHFNVNLQLRDSYYGEILKILSAFEKKITRLTKQQSRRLKIKLNVIAKIIGRIFDYNRQLSKYCYGGNEVVFWPKL